MCNKVLKATAALEPLDGLFNSSDFGVVGYLSALKSPVPPSDDSASTLIVLSDNPSKPADFRKEPFV